MTSQSPKTIIVVGDDPENAPIFRLALHSTVPGAALVRLKDTFETMAWLERSEHSPNAIFICLRNESDHEKAFLTAIRSSSRYAHVPIILVPGARASMGIRQAESLGATGYLLKPPGLMQLESLMSFLLQGGSSSDLPTWGILLFQKS